jgi:hypothetical protein
MDIDLVLSLRNCSREANFGSRKWGGGGDGDVGEGLDHTCIWSESQDVDEALCSKKTGSGQDVFTM